MTSIPPQVILVTGASSGIGRACCDRLAAAGHLVIGASRRVAAGMGWKSAPLDVRDDTSVATAVAEVISRHRRIDALVHAAGVSIAGAVEDIDTATAQEQLDINYFGTIRLVRAVLPAMRTAGRGRILVIGSIGGLIGLPFLAHYSASKFALDGFVEALRLEIAPFGIEPSIVHPGDIRTAIVANQRIVEGGEAGAYAGPRSRLLAAVAANVAKAPPPDVVARVIERALTRRRLPPRIVVGQPLEKVAVVAHKILPGRVFEWFLRRNYEL